VSGAPSHRYMQAVPACWRMICDGRRDPEGVIWITIFHLPRSGQWLVTRESRGVRGLLPHPIPLYRGCSDRRALQVANAALQEASWREFDDMGAVALHAIRGFSPGELGSWHEERWSGGSSSLGDALFA